MTTTSTSLCLACSGTISPSASSDNKVHVTECCNRYICSRCLSKNPRLTSYNPCLACLGGVGVVASAPEANRKALKVGNVQAEDAFAIGDESDDDDDLSVKDDGGANDPGPLIAAPKVGSPSSDQGITGASNNETEAAAQPPTVDAKSSTDTADESRLRASRNSEYWIKPSDTLVGIALKFGIDGRLLCKMNALPPSTLTVTPHLLHTRTTLVLPPTNRTPSPPPPDIQERLEQRAKERAAKRFQFVTKEVDHSIARAYVALADGNSNEDLAEVKKKSVPDSSVGNAAQGLEGRAVDRYMDDEEWEAQQRAQGLLPKLQGFPFFNSIGSSTSAAAEKGAGRRWSWWGKS
ncbi:hypothetical protein M407DRAFT_64472 [Tulasnella calospora MUT 4182]|uniref:LysM domain-containing protein n=1 Tax=Tulasnella calospora MUT 4182 TaxID=1051891 RepID=A0A0C3QYL0_9AGAM|nr:hypothetical protein M407DRAFT_64472 [Tulasnella calospora MUT 4182]